MKQLFTLFKSCLFLAFFLSVIHSSAQTAGTSLLKSSDLVVIARNTDLDDQFAFVALADIPGNSVIFITDESWDDNDFVFDGSEDVFKWTVQSAGVTAGTVVRFTNESTTTLEFAGSNYGSLVGVNGTVDLNLSAGDQLYIYQTSNKIYDGTIQRQSEQGSIEAGMIYAFNGDNSLPSTYGWLDSPNVHSSSASQLPDNMIVLTTSDGTGNAGIANANGMLTQGLVTLSQAMIDSDSSTQNPDEFDNYKYKGLTTEASKEDWLVRIHTTINWLASDVDTLSIFTGSLAADWVVTSSNTAPTASSFLATPTQYSVYTFATSNFGYADVDGNEMEKIAVNLIPSNGVLYLDADNQNDYDLGEELANGANVTKADIENYNI